MTAGKHAHKPPPPPPIPFSSPPLLTQESGNVVVDAVADVVDKTTAPFQQLANPNLGAFEKAKGVVAAVAGLAKAPTDFMNDVFARATNSIAQALPSFPAAVVGAPVVGMPHTHTHPPSLIPPAPPIPLPAIGTVLTCCPTVLIGGMPAVRSGDYGIAPTCGAITPVFEVFTGSSKVFIGGSRAARVMDMTRQCMPGNPPAAKAAGAVSKMATAMKMANKVIGGAAKVSKILGVVGAVKKVVDTQMAAQAADDAAMDAAEQGEAAAAEAAGAAASAAAEAAGAVLAAAMMGADLAMGAMATSMGAMMGKDPGAPPCMGAIMMGVPNVLIGGFPMPSWSDVAKGLKKLGAALQNGRRGGAGRGKLFCFDCM